MGRYYSGARNLKMRTLPPFRSQGQRPRFSPEALLTARLLPKAPGLELFGFPVSFRELAVLTHRFSGKEGRELGLCDKVTRLIDGPVARLSFQCSEVRKIAIPLL